MTFHVAYLLGSAPHEMNSLIFSEKINTIMKTRLFKYIENFTTQKREIFS